MVPAFQEFMRQQGQFFEGEEVHEFFLQKFASRSVVDPQTGEVMAVVGKRSSKMNTEEFSAFMELCMGWMLDRFGIEVPTPD